MQLLSFRFNVEDENFASNVFRKDVVTINKTRNHCLTYHLKEFEKYFEYWIYYISWSNFTMVMITRIRILIIVRQKFYISNNDIIIVP